MNKKTKNNADTSVNSLELFISPDGEDYWSGLIAKPNKDNSDGPLASIEGAMKKIQFLHKRPKSPQILSEDDVFPETVTVWVRKGKYHVSQPITITPGHQSKITFSSYKNEKPIIDGGTKISNWKNGKINGKKVWIADIPEIAQGKWSFRQLFVNGERRSRPRLPEKGLFRMKKVPGMKFPASWAGGNDKQFICKKNDVKKFKNLNDVEVVYVHFWIEERSPIRDFNPKTNLVTMERGSRASMVGAHGNQLADYYLDNVFEALKKPGEWYLDRTKGKLYYIPRPGETFKNTEVVAPNALQLLRLTGDPANNNFIENITFKGLTFQHTDWRHPGENEATSYDLLENDSVKRFNRGTQAASGQAAADVPGVITLKGAKNCVFENCDIRNVGWYGIYLANGCRNIRIAHNNLYDLGAGGIKINGTAMDEPESGRTGWNRITDNHIHKAGRIFHSGVGILLMNSAKNLIAHNYIHDLFYSGISCGWIWGYSESASYCNVIEKNHIHTIGQGLLSDMGGVYLLGPQWGTVVRNNLIHDVKKMHYGGWGLYTDEGSSNIILENNICYNTNGNLFHQHYGCENIVRNNIFYCSEEELFAYTRVEPHIGFTFMRNIVVTDGSPIFKNDYSEKGRHIISDLNLFWNIGKGKIVFNTYENGKYDLKKWQKMGYDLNSIVADPMFTAPDKKDFSLSKKSPALKLGFKPIEMKDIGIRYH